MHECVQTSLVLLKLFSLCQVLWEVCQNKALLACWMQSQQLKRNLLVVDGVQIASVDHVSYPQEEPVIVVLILASELSDIRQELLH